MIYSLCGDLTKKNVKITSEFLPCPVTRGWGLGRHGKQLCLKRSCCKMGSPPPPPERARGCRLQRSLYLPQRCCHLGPAACPSSQRLWFILRDGDLRRVLCSVTENSGSCKGPAGGKRWGLFETDGSVRFGSRKLCKTCDTWRDCRGLGFQGGLRG